MYVHWNKSKLLIGSHTFISVPKKTHSTPINLFYFNSNTFCKIQYFICVYLVWYLQRKYISCYFETEIEDQKYKKFWHVTSPPYFNFHVYCSFKSLACHNCSSCWRHYNEIWHERWLFNINRKTTDKYLSVFVEVTST